MLAGERLTQPHRTHTYQRLCDAGWSHQRVDAGHRVGDGRAQLLGAASLTPYPSLRAAADLAAAALLALYLRSPALLGQPTPGRSHAGPAQRGGLRCATLIVSHYFRRRPARRRNGCPRWPRVGCRRGRGDVLTGMPNHPTGVLPPEYRRAVRRRERRDGYAVLRTWLYATPNEASPARRCPT